MIRVITMKTAIIFSILLLYLIGAGVVYGMEIGQSYLRSGNEIAIPDSMAIQSQGTESNLLPQVVRSAVMQENLVPIRADSSTCITVSRPPANPEYASDRLIVKYKPGTILRTDGQESISLKLNNGIGAKILENENQLGVTGMEVVRLPQGLSVDQAISYYTNSTAVEYAEPDYLLYALPTSNIITLPSPIQNPIVSDTRFVNTPKIPDIVSSKAIFTSRSPPSPTPTSAPISPNISNGYMHISPGERILIEELSEKTATLPQVQEISPQGNVDLLQYLPYTGSLRSQGNCGNCWVWASTGVLEIDHAVQTGINKQLSIQYFNSNYRGGGGTYWACTGGWAEYFSSFHSTNGYKQVIPWSNTNAYYADSNACPSGVCSGTKMPASSISTVPNYPMTSISTANIVTSGVTQQQAIANLKAQVNNNKAIWWAFFLPNSSSWSTFSSFWAYQPE